MKATQTSTDRSKCDTEQGNSEQNHSNQPRQNEELVRVATCVAWTWFVYEKSDTEKEDMSKCLLSTI